MLEARNLTKIYRPKKGEPVTALNNVNVQLGEKGLVFLLGKSGSGKSTLLNLLGGLDSISSGEIIIKGKSSAKFTQSDFDSYRNTFIGFIFQEFNILEDYSVGHNIGLSMELQHKKRDDAAIDALLEQVDLQGYANRKPNELSGGQKQRVAIARALIKNPEIIMADEPTGALDSKTGKQVFDTLKKLSREKLVIVVSHDRENAEIYGDRVIELADGVIIQDRMRTSGGQLVELPVNYIGSKLVHIKAGHQLTAADVAQINSLLKTTTEDSFISFDEKANIEFSKKVAVSGGGGTFTATTPQNNPVKQYDAAQFKLVRSRLPFKDSFKMGASGLKLKKVRLVFTILLSFIAFTMFGFANTVSFFDPYTTELQTMHDEGHTMLTVFAQNGYHNAVAGTSWSQYYSGSREKLTAENIDKLEELTGSPMLRPFQPEGYRSSTLINIPSHAKDATSSGTKYLYYESNNNIGNFIEVPDMAAGSFTLLAGKAIESFTEYNEIAISDYMADYFIKYGYCEPGKDKSTDGVTIANYQALIGKKLKADLGYSEKASRQLNVSMIISGIYKTDIDVSKWESFKNLPVKDASMFDSNSISALSNMFVTMGYVKSGFNSEYINLTPDADGETKEKNSAHFDSEILFGDPDISYRTGHFGTAYYYKNSSKIYWGKNASNQPNPAPASLASNEIVVYYDNLAISAYDYSSGYGVYSEQKIKDEFDQYVTNDPEWLQAELTIKDRENATVHTENFVVKGVIMADPNNWQSAFPDGVPYLMMNNDKADELAEIYAQAYTQENTNRYESVRVDGYGVADYDTDKIIPTYGYGEFIKYGTHNAYLNNFGSGGEIYWGAGKSARVLADDEIIICANKFDSDRWVNGIQEIITHTKTEKIAYFDAMLSQGKNNAKLGKVTDVYNQETESWDYRTVRGRAVKIVGIYFWNSGGNQSDIVSEAIFAELQSYANMPTMGVIKLSGNMNKDRAVINYLIDTVQIENGSAFRVGTLTILTPILTMAEMFTGVLKTVFLWVSVVFSAFAGLLLMNFIGVSVSAKKKDIGILRAIGARSADVFKIFLNEGLLIGLINIVLSITALIVLSTILNNMLGVGLLVPGFLQFLFMALLCFGVVVVATFLPVRKIARKKPIDAINNR